MICRDTHGQARAGKSDVVMAMAICGHASDVNTQQRAALNNVLNNVLNQEIYAAFHLANLLFDSLCGVQLQQCIGLTHLVVDGLLGSPRRLAVI